MSVADVKSKAVKNTRAKKVTADEQATVSAALDAAPLEHAPLSAFVVSPLNARTIPYSAESVESLAATIKSVGLLQNLVAHALPDGQLAVAAGGRRLTALNLLLSQQVLRAIIRCRSSACLKTWRRSSLTSKTPSAATCMRQSR